MKEALTPARLRFNHFREAKLLSATDAVSPASPLAATGSAWALSPRYEQARGVPGLHVFRVLSHIIGHGISTNQETLPPRGTIAVCGRGRWATCFSS